MKKAITLLAVALFLTLPVFASVTDTACLSLVSNVPYTTITSSSVVPTASVPWTSPTSSFGTATISSPSFCRVVGVIAPTSDSVINFELWMPTGTAYNGRFQGVGNGALGGGIAYPAMYTALAAGYATASTDTGHIGSSSDASYAFTPDKVYHPQKIIDWGYRSIHLMTVASKSLVNQYYGSGPTRSYFTGCSGGGQQAISEAQRYPDDYDGIVAGAPSNYFTHLDAGQIFRAQTNLGSTAGFVDKAQLTMLNAAVLAACDGIDGVVDGIISDPRRCNFDPTALLCTGAASDSCLTAAQVATVKTLYAGPKNPVTGAQVFPAYSYGSETAPPQGWSQFVGAGNFGKAVNPIANSFFSYMVYQNPTWDYTTFDFNTGMAYADTQVGAMVNSINPDLSLFKAGGHKLIHYHGFADPNIPTQNSINYYESVAAFSSAPLSTLQGYYRLFLVPGMGHCNGGNGTDTFDALGALVDWVEQGRAPDTILASHIDSTSKATTITRPLCPYPQEATYRGSGSIYDATNFSCVANLSISAGSPASLVVTTTGTAPFQFLISPSPATKFSAPVTFTVSGLPAGATATFSPASLPAGSGATTVTMTVQLGSLPLAGLGRHSRLGSGLGVTMVGMLLLPFGARLRRAVPKRGRHTLMVILLLAVAAGAMVGLTSCGSSASNNGISNVKNYTVTMTATSGVMSQSSSVLLTAVQP